MTTQSPPIFDDQQRVAALRRLHLLDTEPEPFFEDLIELLQTICGAPIALVSLTDFDRQWFKARRGIDAKEVPRRGSPCTHVVESGKPLVVNDAASDPVFRNCDLVTGPTGIRAYAGAPIFIDGGHAIGTVCALDKRTRDWGAHEAAHLARAARMVASHAQARAIHAELAAEHSRAEEREAATYRQRAIISAMSEGVVVHDAKGSIIECNRAACNILGLTEDQIHGRTSLDPRWQALDQAGLPLTGKNHPAMRVLATGEPVEHFPMTVMRPDAVRRHLLVSATPLLRDKAAGEHGVVATFVDITEQIAQQRQLGELLERAEHANRAKSEFLAAMSHEVRTPLNGLLGVAQHLARKVSDPALSGSIALLRTSGMALKDIVDDALDIDRIETGVLSLREADFSPAQIVAEVAEIYQAVAAEKKLKLTVVMDISGSVLVRGDAGRIRQILHNLVNNAVKFTEKGEVHIDVTLGERLPAGPLLCIEVSDTGRGIAPEFSDTLFAKFARGSEAASDTAGAGLGLYLSLKLARLMKGDLRYSPNSPVGSRFRVECPVERVASGVETTHPLVVASAGQIDVLVAEDHHINREIIALLLEPFGITPTFVNDGSAALDAAKTGAFDLILMDRQMPVLDGVQATRQLRTWEREVGRSPIPVIFVSANGTSAAIAEAREAGADGYVLKPLVAEALASEIFKLLKT